MSRRRRRILIALALPSVALAGVWFGIHHTSWMGPMIADGARAVIGANAVARLEELAYGVEDRWNRFRHKNDVPKAYWDVPPAPPVAAAPSVDGGAPGSPPFAPANVAPMHEQWAAPGDGVWVPIPDPRHPNDATGMYKTLLHPDRKRSWTAVSIVAIDLKHVDLHLVAGRHEPEATEPEAKSYARPALVPEEHHEALLAAFNGGFKTEHGHYGMRVDGVTLVKPRPDGCTVARYADGTLAIRTFAKLADTEPQMTWWRETPSCMVEQGEMHPGLALESNTHWGSTLDRETVIRRSAIGLSKDQSTLYVGIGDATTARAIAEAMAHAGALDVAQLDINYSYPKFLLYEPRSPGSPELVAKPLCKGFEYSEDDYIRSRSPRDFFYLTRKEPVAERTPVPPDRSASAH